VPTNISAQAVVLQFPASVYALASLLWGNAACRGIQRLVKPGRNAMVSFLLAHPFVFAVLFSLWFIAQDKSPRTTPGIHTSLRPYFPNLMPFAFVTPKSLRIDKECDSASPDDVHGAMSIFRYGLTSGR